MDYIHRSQLRKNKAGTQRVCGTISPRVPQLSLRGKKILSNAGLLHFHHRRGVQCLPEGLQFTSSFCCTRHKSHDSQRRFQNAMLLTYTTVYVIPERRNYLKLLIRCLDTASSSGSTNFKAQRAFTIF